MKPRITACLVYGLACAVALAFLYPFIWMVLSSFRTQEAILSTPLRLWPETFDLSGFRALGRIGGVPLRDYAVNSIVITGLATALGVCITGLGAYALHRNPRLPLFSIIRYGFLVKVMYPNMLLVIPLYFVAHKLGLLGTMLGIVLVISTVPLVFFLFVEFFRSIPGEMIEAARIDGASEWQILIGFVDKGQLTSDRHQPGLCLFVCRLLIGGLQLSAEVGLPPLRKVLHHILAFVPLTALDDSFVAHDFLDALVETFPTVDNEENFTLHAKSTVPKGVDEIAAYAVILCIRLDETQKDLVATYRDSQRDDD